MASYNRGQSELGEQRRLIEDRLADVEKFVHGETTDEEAERLRKSTTAATWQEWCQRRLDYQRMEALKAEGAALEALIAECTAPLGDRDGMPVLLHRNNRLLAAILRKLSEPR